MNRQSTKKTLLIPYILMVLTAIAIVIVGFIFKPLIGNVYGDCFNDYDRH